MLDHIFLIPGMDEAGSPPAPTPVLSWSGPTSGEVGSQSTDFTVSITDPPAGDTIITFASNGSGDSFSVATRTLNSGNLSATVKLTPGTAGARNITITNDRAISNPSAVVYTSAYETDYAAILARAVTLGYTQPSAAQRIKQQTLLKALKTAGIWAKLDVFYLFCNDGSKEFATLNWKAPSSYQIALASSPVFTSNQGIAGDGVSAYMETSFNPSTNGVQYTQDNASRFAWVYSAVASAPMDSMAGGLGNRMLSSSASSQRINQGVSANLNSAADLSGTGLRQINRTSSTNVELFSGTTQISRTATSAAMSNATQQLLRSNATFGANSLSAYGLGASLVAENAALNTALNTYVSAP